MANRKEKVEHSILEVAGRFLNEHSNRQSLITASRVLLSSDMSKATVFFTVYPRNKEKAVFDFLMRKRTDFRSFLKEEMYLKRLPFVDFQIDNAEKKRQDFDELVLKLKNEEK